MCRLPAEISNGPELEAVASDYCLPLNVVRKTPDEGFDQQGPKETKKGRTELGVISEKQLVGSAGMNDELYQALVTYLKE